MGADDWKSSRLIAKGIVLTELVIILKKKNKSNKKQVFFNGNEE